MIVKCLRIVSAKDGVGICTPFNNDVTAYADVSMDEARHVRAIQ